MPPQHVIPAGAEGRTLLGLAIFLIVMALAISRPRGLNEAWPAVGGTAVLFILGFLAPADLLAVASETGGVLVFLFGMMVLSTVVELVGVFKWAASHAGRSSGGDGRRLLVNIFLLGAVVTALLSLDATVIILTPVVYATVVALRIDPLPYLYAHLRCEYRLLLQSLRLQVGTHVVLLGSLIGVGLTLVVAALNFLSHYRLPYQKMLVLTGILLGGVLVVMVGETVQEMQQAHWLRHGLLMGVGRRHAAGRPDMWSSKQHILDPATASASASEPGRVISVRPHPVSSADPTGPLPAADFGFSACVSC